MKSKKLVMTAVVLVIAMMFSVAPVYANAEIELETLPTEVSSNIVLPEDGQIELTLASEFEDVVIDYIDTDGAIDIGNTRYTLRPFVGPQWNMAYPMFLIPGSNDLYYSTALYAYEDYTGNLNQIKLFSLDVATQNYLKAYVESFGYTFVGWKSATQIKIQADNPRVFTHSFNGGTSTSISVAGYNSATWESSYMINNAGDTARWSGTLSYLSDAGTIVSILWTSGVVYQS